MPIIHVHSFIKRHIPESRFSHSSRSWDDIAAEVLANLDQGKVSGFNAAVLEVSIDPAGSFSGVCKLEAGQKLVGEFASRPGHDDEAPRKSVRAVGATKMPAAQVKVILFPSTLLAETDQNELDPADGNWEMISFNASATEGEEPIGPDTLMHNHFGSDGGTATGLSAEEFVAKLQESFLFWQDKVMIAESA